jgi:hypothetical protein|tara:strand:- start:539 stop:715 length:177 start_codon:yes stop_codon:yes gene_type:complete
MVNAKNKLTPTQSRAARRDRKEKKRKFTKWLIGSAFGLIAILLVAGLILPSLQALWMN